MKTTVIAATALLMGLMSVNAAEAGSNRGILSFSETATHRISPTKAQRHYPKTMRHSMGVTRQSGFAPVRKGPRNNRVHRAH